LTSTPIPGIIAVFWRPLHLPVTAFWASETVSVHRILFCPSVLVQDSGEKTNRAVTKGLINGSTGPSIIPGMGVMKIFIVCKINAHRATVTSKSSWLIFWLNEWDILFSNHEGKFANVTVTVTVIMILFESHLESLRDRTRLDHPVHVRGLSCDTTASGGCRYPELTAYSTLSE
jgi:hypothetical protein